MVFFIVGFVVLNNCTSDTLGGYYYHGDLGCGVGGVCKAILA